MDIDVRVFRWVSEIVADGSEIRSLSGRNCRLADGTSRKPADRNEIIAQRTKDVEGIAGQVRIFNLDRFLSDCEHPDVAIPWAVGDDCVPPSNKEAKSSAQVSGCPVFSGASAAAPLDLPLLMASAGVCPTLQVLYVPDYVVPNARVLATQQLAKKLEQVFP